MFRLNRILCVVAIVAAAVAVNGCGVASDAGTVMVRVANAVPAAGGVDFSVNGSNWILGMSFSGVTTYGYLTQGDNTFTAVGTGSVTVVPPATFNLPPQGPLTTGAYTIVATGSTGVVGAPPAFLMFPDTNTLPITAKCRVRVINVAAGPAPEPTPVDVTVTAGAVSQSLATGLAYGTQSLYSSIIPATYTIHIRKTGSLVTDQDLLNTSLALVGGRTYTIFIEGPDPTAGTLKIVGQWDI